MDLICFRCGEPWSLDDVLHDFKDDFTRQGCVISRCPICMSKAHVELSSEHRSCLNDLAVAAAMFGDDCDGFACFLEDVHWN